MQPMPKPAPSPRLYEPEVAPAAEAPELTLRQVVELYDRTEEPKRNPRAAAERIEVRRRFLAATDEHGQVLGDLSVSQARAHHLRLWLEAQAQAASNWTRLRYIRTIQRPFNWAVNELELIERNPFRAVHNRPGERGRALTDQEFAAMLRGSDALFRRVLILARRTGMRPGELSAFQRPQIELDLAHGEGWIVLTKHKTSTTQREPRPRLIALDGPSVKLLVWILKRRMPWDDQVYQNARGHAWTRNSLSLRIQRLRARLGLPEDAKLYGCRHLFATEYVVQGGDLATLAELLGHTTVAMARHYVHLAGRKQHLLDEVKRANAHGRRQD